MAPPCSTVNVLTVSSEEVAGANVHRYAVVAPCWTGAPGSLRTDARRYVNSVYEPTPSTSASTHSFPGVTTVANLLPVARNLCISTFTAGPRPMLFSFLSAATRSEEHTSELQSQSNLVCRLLLEKKTNQIPHSQVLSQLSFHNGVERSGRML